jgi:hypothetical protein
MHGASGLVPLLVEQIGYLVACQGLTGFDRV